ncbi:MAG: O-antigen ligase family protein [Nitrospirae bacterium]|nr:O-antigen ligase family protein [Nitrospirota bacterium]
MRCAWVYACFLLLSPFEFGSRSLLESVVLNILMATLAAMAVVAIAAEREPRGIRIPLHSWLLLAWAAWSCATFAYSINRYLTVYQGTKLIVFAAGATLPFMLWQARETFDRFLGTVIVSAAIFVVFGFYQYSMGLTQLTGRVNSIFITPNTLAAYVNLGFLSALGFFLRGRTPAQGEKETTGARATKILWIGYLISALVASIYTGSIGGWIGLAAGLAVFALLYGVPHFWRRIWKPGLAAVAAGALTILFSGLPLAQHLKRIWEAQGSGVTRLFIWESAWKACREYPFWGSGLATFHLTHVRLKDLTLFKSLHHFFVHNDYLQALEETGVPGLLLLLGWIGALYAYLFHLRSRLRHDGDRVLLASAGGALASVFAQSMVDFNLVVPAILNVSALNVAVCAFLGRSQDSEDRVASEEGSRLKHLLLGIRLRVGGRPLTRTRLLVLCVGYLAAVVLLSVQFISQQLEDRAYEMGRSQSDRGRILRAIALQEWALRFFPWNAQARQSLSRYASEAARLSPRPEERKFHLDMAEVEARRAIRWGPEEFSNYWWLGRLYWQTPEFSSRQAEAESNLLEALRHHPSSPSLPEELLRFYQERREWRKIPPVVVQFTNLYPDRLSQVARYQIQAYAHLGRPLAAEAWVDQMLKPSPRSGYYLMWKGRLRADAGDWTSAREALLAALEVAGSRKGRVYDALARLEEKTGNRRRAREYRRLATEAGSLSEEP